MTSDGLWVERQVPESEPGHESHVRIDIWPSGADPEEEAPMWTLHCQSPHPWGVREDHPRGV